MKVWYQASRMKQSHACSHTVCESISGEQTRAHRESNCDDAADAELYEATKKDGTSICLMSLLRNNQTRGSTQAVNAMRCHWSKVK